MNDLNLLINNHRVSYELARHLQAESLRNLQSAYRESATNSAPDRTRFMIKFHLRSWIYRLVPRIAARLML